MALGSCDVITEHPALEAVHAKQDSTERSETRDNTEKKVLLWLAQPQSASSGQLEQGGEGGTMLTQRSYHGVFTVACHREVEDSFQEISHSLGGPAQHHT